MPVVAKETTLNSLGFAKPPSATRVVVAMSGGVDSSVVAAQLASEGYDVVGITLQLYDHGEAVGRVGSCCAGQDIRDARAVADKLGSAVRIGKRAFYDQIQMSLAQAYDYTGAVMVENMLDDDTAEGIDAFIEKRAPDWKQPG